jgi:hypothetical protein
MNPILAKAMKDDPQTFTTEGLVCALTQIYNPGHIPEDVLVTLQNREALASLTPDEALLKYGNDKDAAYIGHYIDTLIMRNNYLHSEVAARDLACEEGLAALQRKDEQLQQQLFELQQKDQRLQRQFVELRRKETELQDKDIVIVSKNQVIKRRDSEIDNMVDHVLEVESGMEYWRKRAVAAEEELSQQASRA